jgi:hypothetical protein
LVSGRRLRGKIALKADEATKAVAFHEGEEAGEGQKAKPPEITISASAQQVCVQSFTHALQLSWDISEGVPFRSRQRSPIQTSTSKIWS